MDIEEEIIKSLRTYIDGVKSFVDLYKRVGNEQLTFANNEIRSTKWSIRIHVHGDIVQYMTFHGRKMSLNKCVEYVLHMEKMHCSGW